MAGRLAGNAGRKLREVMFGKDITPQFQCALTLSPSTAHIKQHEGGPVPPKFAFGTEAKAEPFCNETDRNLRRVFFLFQSATCRKYQDPLHLVSFGYY